MPAQPGPQPLELPRGLIFLGSLWLIGSWFVAIGPRSPIQPVSDSYTPGVRLMLLCLTIGLMIGWPLLRLSQRPSAAPIRQTLLDLSALLALVQVVIWPLRLVTPWSALRTAAIDATIASWAILAGAAVASATGTTRGGPRQLAMFACIAMCLLGPAIASIGAIVGVDLTGVLEYSPILAVRQLTDAGGAQPAMQDWMHVGGVAVIVLAGWLMLLLAMRRPQRLATP